MRRIEGFPNFILKCSAALVLFSLAGTLKAEEPIDIRLATLLPRGSSYHQILMAMREKWRQAPGGGVKLTIYPAGTMGGEADMVRRMRVGELQASVLTAVGLSDIDDSVTSITYMPMMFRSLDEVDYVLDKLRPTLEKRLQDKGFVVLFWGNVGWIRFFSTQPLVRPPDLKRIRMFVWSGDAHEPEIWKAAGYQAVSLETNDILPGLQTGLISAVPCPPFIALAGQFYTTARHMLELNWAPLIGATVITRSKWESIPSATRDVLLKAASDAGQQMSLKSRSENEQAIEAMKKRGLTVRAVTPEIEAEWRRAVEEAYPKIRGALVPAAMFDEVRRLLQERRAASAGDKK